MPSGVEASLDFLRRFTNLTRLNAERPMFNIERRNHLQAGAQIE
jgi:hypothetical protein